MAATAPTQRGRATRERLLDAALEIVASKGYGQASVVAIAERAGVATGTLYRHFPSKEQMFVELFRSVCDREVRAMERGDDPSAPPTDRAVSAITTFAERALRNPSLAWALLAEPVDALVDVERLAYRRRYRDHLASIIQEGIRDGLIPTQDSLTSAAGIVGGVGEMLVGPLSPVDGPRRPAVDVLDEVAAFTRRVLGG